MQEEKNINTLQEKVKVLEISLEESKAQELLYKSKIGSATPSQIKCKFRHNVLDIDSAFIQISLKPMQRILTKLGDTAPGCNFLQIERRSVDAIALYRLKANIQGIPRRGTHV